MKTSIVIPARNEARNIGACVRALVAALRGMDHEIIVVNDGSTDGTGEAVDALGTARRIDRPRGKNGFGLALRTGIAAATGDHVALVMADLSDDVDDLKHMIRVATRTGCDVVTGNRFARQGGTTAYPPVKRVANRLFNHLIAVLFKAPYKDLSNAFKLYRKDFLDSISIDSTGFDITIELPVKAWIMGKQIVEIPNKWYGRKDGSPKWSLLRDGMSYVRRAMRLLALKKHVSRERSKRVVTTPGPVPVPRRA